MCSFQVVTLIWVKPKLMSLFFNILKLFLGLKMGRTLCDMIASQIHLLDSLAQRDS